jgi:hypothetical protein
MIHTKPHEVVENADSDCHITLACDEDGATATASAIA